MMNDNPYGEFITGRLKAGDSPADIVSGIEESLLDAEKSWAMFPLPDAEEAT